MAEKRGLGRGLSALIGDAIPPETADSGDPVSTADRSIPIEFIEPNPDQPRRDFDQQDLQDLAASIRAKGVLQPLLVRPFGDAGKYQIIAGERRWRAAQIAQMHEVPVLVRSYNDAEVLEIAIIENIQRADLNPIEEAMGYQQLIDRFGHTPGQLGEALSKSRSHIANLLRLLNLPEAARDMVRRGELSAGHARTLLTAQHPMRLARQIVEKGLSVREAEKLARGGAEPKQTKRRARSEKDADTVALENDLAATLGMRVTIDHTAGSDGGTLSVRYGNLDDLDQLCQALSQIERMAH